LHFLVGREPINAGRVGEVKQSFGEQLARDYNDVASLVAMGNVALAGQDTALALRHHTKAYSLKPDDPNLALTCMMDYLTASRYQEARQIFRSRRRAICSLWGHGSHYSGFAPEWDGSPLEAKTILIHGAVGLGDTIQYCRLLSLLKDEGGTVVLEVPGPLTSLMQTLGTTDFVVSRPDPFPPIPLDFECDLREIFLLRDVPPCTFASSVPYILPPEELRRRWASSVAAPDSLKIGIVWNGGQLLRSGPLSKRSMPLDRLRPLAEIPGVSLLSLQVGPGSNDLNGRPWTTNIINLASRIRDFADTAAIVSHLDVVVTIDTSVAHLAGAMGKRSFLMLPILASWRWETKREDCIWYPTMRLFRMREAGDWQSVVARVKAAVLELLAPGRNKEAQA
jgi:hypothetical protein